MLFYFFFFFQAEDGIRDGRVTGVQTCALPISYGRTWSQWRNVSIRCSDPSAGSAYEIDHRRIFSSFSAAYPPCSRGRTAQQLCALPRSGRDDDADRACLRALRTFLNFVLHFRPLGEALVPLAADRAVVDEDVLASIVLRDEAVALVVAEPLHGSGCHIYTSLDCVTNVQRKAQAETGTRSNSCDHGHSTAENAPLAERSRVDLSGHATESRAPLCARAF